MMNTSQTASTRLKVCFTAGNRNGLTFRPETFMGSQARVLQRSFTLPTTNCTQDDSLTHHSQPSFYLKPPLRVAHHRVLITSSFQRVGLETQVVKPTSTHLYRKGYISTSLQSSVNHPYIHPTPSQLGFLHPRFLSTFCTYFCLTKPLGNFRHYNAFGGRSPYFQDGCFLLHDMVRTPRHSQ